MRSCAFGLLLLVTLADAHANTPQVCDVSKVSVLAFPFLSCLSGASPYITIALNVLYFGLFSPINSHRFV